ncbi:TPA: hypothetical protein DEO28_04945 [Candidatus Dependentiae bacterium]|nr:MAG: hypothetical protein UR14_C0002G0102 [candidate division TM6 bacterium GW2011_GWE2_31_21]KKP53899.1 MAG: hypothetical protein UR43_C0002G0102 [candidate division TM6 bacterium GW2011_GWF2_33_332]HBS47679.1 hypothetical protein [Candidatus Dependentiae bacterium]HBZ73828.1 hypothetical protein [Candidatus Dependentiae bacterium]
MKSYKFRFEHLIICLTVLYFVLFIFFSFYNLQNFILQIYDDHVYSGETKNFLTSGVFHWAGAKPGIILIAALFGLSTPYKVIYLMTIFAFISALGLFLLAKMIFKNSYLSLIPVILWMNSEFFFYYSKTHLLIFVAFYFLGVWICYKALQNLEWWKYYLGCFLLGYSVLTYYVIIFYLPVIFIFLYYLFYKKGLSFFSYILKTFIPFVLPIILLDFFVTFFYFFLGKKNWPFLYSVFGQYKYLSRAASNINFSRIVYFPTLFCSTEFKFVTILICLGLILFLISLFKNFRKNFFDSSFLLLLILLIPVATITLRFCLGSFTALRAFGSALPILYILIGFFFYKIISKKYSTYILLLFVCYGFWNLIFIQPVLSKKYKTGYCELESFINKTDFKTVVYFGGFNSLEQILNNKTVIPMNIGSDCFMIFKDELKKQAFFNSLKIKLGNLETIALVLICDKKSLDFVISEISKDFKVNEIEKIANNSSCELIQNEGKWGDIFLFNCCVEVSYINIYELELKNGK